MQTQPKRNVGDFVYTSVVRSASGTRRELLFPPFDLVKVLGACYFVFTVVEEDGIPNAISTYRLTLAPRPLVVVNSNSDDVKRLTEAAINKTDRLSR